MQSPPYADAVAAGPAGRGREAQRPGSAGLRRRVLVPGTWVAGTAAAFAVYLRLAQTRAVNSDGASQALQAWDMLHGNPLLRGWTVSDVSFYPTELPQYALVELIRGLHADVVTICAAMTYTLAVLLAALVGKGTATGRQALLRVAVPTGIMLAPQLDSGTNVLLSSPDHIGTSVPLLLAWLVLDRGGRRWYIPVITSALLFLAEVADSIAVIAGIIPLALVCAARAGWFARQRSVRDVAYELAMAGGALAAAEAARSVLSAITDAGGFTDRPLGTQLAPLSAIVPHNLRVTAQCLLLLFGAHTGGPSTREVTFFLLLHLAGVGLAAAGVAVAAWRIPRGGDPASQVLLAAIAVNVGAFIVTKRAVDVTSAREIAPVLPFAAALAARQLSPALLLASRLLIVIGIGYVAGLTLELTAPAAPPQGAPLTAWLESHHLGSVGLGGYWQSSVVTLTSGDTVAIRPITDDGNGAGAYQSEIKDAWFDPRRGAAHFVVLNPGGPEYPGFADYPAVRATWGNPARVYRVGQYTIWYWPTNLLSAIRH